MLPTANHLSRIPKAVAIAGLVLSGCGVSGKVAHSASPTTEAAPTTTTTAPGQTVPETTDPTAPGDTGSTGTTDTTSPDSSNPFGSDDIKSTLIRIYKESGFTDKEARCVADLVVKGSGGKTFDPSKLDISKLTTAARECLGGDGIPGGDD